MFLADSPILAPVRDFKRGVSDVSDIESIFQLDHVNDGRVEYRKKRFDFLVHLRDGARINAGFVLVQGRGQMV